MIKMENEGTISAVPSNAWLGPALPDERISAAMENRQDDNSV